MILHGAQYVMIRENAWRLASRMKRLVRAFREQPQCRLLLLPAIYAIAHVLQRYREELYNWSVRSRGGGSASDHKMAGKCQPAKALAVRGQG